MNNDPKFAYRESAARVTTPVGRVVLLYEQAIQDLGGAVAAIGSQEIEPRTQKIGHALLVIGQLQACLDLERGGEVGRNLDRFYALVRQRLLEAQINASAVILREQMDLLLSVRAAWIEVEKTETQAAADVASQAGPPGSGTSVPDSAPSRWRA
ncbi:MAG: flagellar export chaperone FliS [Terriglobales bacterium]